jgi:hypothetical protein
MIEARPEDFKNHAVTTYHRFLLGTVEYEVLVWKAPNTSICFMRFVRAGSTLMVSGDVGDAVYQWPSTQSLRWMSDTHISYFMGKCQASPHGRGFKIWDEEHFDSSAISHIREAYSDAPEGVADAVEKHYKDNKDVRIIGDYTSFYLWAELFAFSYIMPPPNVNAHLKKDLKEFENITNGEFYFRDNWEMESPSGLTLDFGAHQQHCGLKLAVAWLDANNPDWDQAPYNSLEKP